MSSTNLPDCYIVSGPQGSGKTVHRDAIARALLVAEVHDGPEGSEAEVVKFVRDLVRKPAAGDHLVLTSLPLSAFSTHTTVKHYMLTIDEALSIAGVQRRRELVADLAERVRDRLDGWAEFDRSKPPASGLYSVWHPAFAYTGGAVVWSYKRQPYAKNFEWYEADGDVAYFDPQYIKALPVFPGLQAIGK